MQITWDNSWNIGCEELDRQHQKWVKLFNNLEAAVLSDFSTDEVRKATVKEMLAYTYYHFAYEEKLMADKNYPVFVRHRRLHKNFDNIVYAMYRKLEDGDFLLNSEILSLIKNWFQEHIQIEDQKFGAYLRTKK